MKQKELIPEIDEDGAAAAIEPTVGGLICEFDALDYHTVREAMEVRMTAFGGLLPPGGGNMDGRIIAEICRGWLEMLRAPKTRKRARKAKP